MTTPPLSPDERELAELSKAFAGLAEVFKKLAEPRYTMAEIERAMEKHCWSHFREVEQELEAGRVRDRAA